MDGVSSGWRRTFQGAAGGDAERVALGSCAAAGTPGDRTAGMDVSGFHPCLTEARRDVQRCARARMRRSSASVTASRASGDGWGGLWLGLRLWRRGLFEVAQLGSQDSQAARSGRARPENGARSCARSLWAEPGGCERVYSAAASSAVVARPPSCCRGRVCDAPCADACKTDAETAAASRSPPEPPARRTVTLQRTNASSANTSRRTMTVLIASGSALRMLETPSAPCPIESAHGEGNDSARLWPPESQARCPCLAGVVPARRRGTALRARTTTVRTSSDSTARRTVDSAAHRRGW